MNVQEAAKALYDVLPVPMGCVNTMGVTESSGRAVIRIFVDSSLIDSPHLFPTSYKGYPVRIEKRQIYSCAATIQKVL